MKMGRSTKRKAQKSPNPENVIGLGDIARGGGPEPTPQTETLCPSNEGPLAETDFGQDKWGEMELQIYNSGENSESETLLGDNQSAQPIGQGDFTSPSLSVRENFAPGIRITTENREPMGGCNLALSDKGANRPNEILNIEEKNPRSCAAAPGMTSLKDGRYRPPRLALD